MFDSTSLRKAIFPQINEYETAGHSQFLIYVKKLQKILLYRSEVMVLVGNEVALIRLLHNWHSRYLFSQVGQTRSLRFMKAFFYGAK